jgi:7-cyano-7-deazaguanine synthase
VPDAKQAAKQESGPPAVCLVSGGMDSAVALAEAKAAGFAPYALTFRYGQRHEHEVAAAARVAKALGALEHRVVAIDLPAIAPSSLTGRRPVPKDRLEREIGTGVPSTYVPARNTVFLALALGWAEALGARDIFLGVNAVDYSGYPDCRPEFLAAFEALASVATAAGAERGARFKLHAPLLRKTKAGVVQRAAELGVDLALTHTCYDPIVQDGEVLACGRCDACTLRLKGFREAGREDPAAYAVQPGSALGR